MHPAIEWIGLAAILVFCWYLIIFGIIYGIGKKPRPELYTRILWLAAPGLAGLVVQII